MDDTRINNTVTQIASTTAVVGGLTFNEWVAISGLLVAVVSAIYNVWHTSEMRRIATTHDRRTHDRRKRPAKHHTDKEEP
jgi:hypothetical protein